MLFTEIVWTNIYRVDRSTYFLSKSSTLSQEHPFVSRNTNAICRAVNISNDEITEQISTWCNHVGKCTTIFSNNPNIVCKCEKYWIPSSRALVISTGRGVLNAAWWVEWPNLMSLGCPRGLMKHAVYVVLYDMYIICCIIKRYINTLRPRRNEQHFAGDIFKRIFFNENVWISIKISLKFVPNGPINNIPALVQIMAWCRLGDKPLSELMVVSLPTHICFTRPQWVKVD